MTSQKNYSITLEEIIAIRFKCQSCKVAMSIPISSQGRVPVACPFCSDSWIIKGRDDLFQEFLVGVNQLVSSIKKVGQGTNNANCVVSVEINPEIEFLDGQKA